ncbi:MAG: DegV family protein [Clostridiaceae bacterium]|nr:DegV family protein [Clostridiaceae bacterium]
MRTVKIITDSASDLPAEFFEKYDISMLPMGIVVDNKTYLDRVDLDLATLFEIIKENPQNVPKTVMPLASTMTDEFRKNLQTFEHQIFVCISSKGSGTYNLANMVKSEIEEQIGGPSNITVVDSMSFSAGYGLAVMKMAKAAYEGADFNTVMSVFNNNLERTHVFLIVDDLQHLQRGGRINPSAAFVGEMLGIKPILTIKNGMLDSFSKARGKRKAIEMLAQLLLERVKRAEDTNTYFVHTNASQEVQLIKDYVLSKITPNETMTFELGPCVGSHTGIGLLGIVFTV